MVVVGPGLSINPLGEERFGRRGGQGFTIIEALIAMLLLVITLTGGIAFYYNANTLYYRGLHLTQATTAAESRMEEVKSAGYDAIVSDSETNANVTIGDLQVSGNVRTQIFYKGGPDNTHYVIVTVTWREPGDSVDRDVVLETYIGP